MGISFYLTLAANSLVFFSAQLSSFIIFPFLPFMVSSFFPELDRSELGKAAGYLGSAFFFGYIPGCLFFALLADKIGRRFVMIFTMVGVAACQLVFGFSLNFAMAIVARIASGFFGGGIATARTYTSEISNENNKAFAFAIVGSMSAMGRITGSIIGGFLAQPGSKYGLFEIPFFCRFQFLLPCLVGAGIALVSAFCGILFVKETLEKNPSSKSEGFKLHILQNGKSKPKLYKPTLSSMCCYYLRAFGQKVWLFFTPLMETKVIVTLLLFGLGPLAFISAVELVPLLFVNDFFHGGYNMDDTEIGVLMLLSTLAIIFTQIILYSLISRCIGYRWTFRITAILFAIFTIIIPFSTKITGPVPANPGTANFSDYCQLSNASITMSVNANSVWRIPISIWAILTVFYSFQTLLRVMYSTGTIVMFGSATSPKSRSFVNGVGQAVYGTSAIIAPLASAPILAWSENNSFSWPLNYHFVFDLVAIFLLGTTMFSFFVPQSIEKDKNASKDKVEDEDKIKEKEDILRSFKIDSNDEDSDEFYD